MKLHRLAALCALTIPLAAVAAPALSRVAPVAAGARTERADQRARAGLALADLDWLAGAWTGKGLGGDVELHWSKPTGGSMVGMSRLVQNGKTGFFEFILIEQDEQGVTLRFQHFNPGFAAWEKNGPLVLDLVESGNGRAVFQSRDPKQSPARMVYSLRDERGLGVLFDSPEAFGGPISFELLYERER
jgi:hypothetical protein